MVIIEWCVVLDSESVLVRSNVLVIRECSSVGHSRSDLESSAIWKWLLGIGVCFLVNEPSFTKLVVAVLIHSISSVNVGTRLNIKALVAVVSDILS